jgi:hypothetical protein
VLTCILLSSVAINPSLFVYAQEPTGTLQPFWNISHGGSRSDEGWCVTTDDEGNVYFAGFDRVSGAIADVFVKKLTADGVELWNMSWDGGFDDKPYIITESNGHIYVGGAKFLSFSPTETDIFILKLHASNGSLVWSRTWDGSGHGYDEVDGLLVDGNSIYVSGWATENSTQTDIVVLKYSENGDLIWSRTWGTSGVDEANGQLGLDENHVYVVGHYDALPLGLGGDAVLVAFNKVDGSYAWNTTWGGSGLDDAFGMAMSSNYIYSVGLTTSFGGDMIFLLKYNANGSLIWNAMWGGSNAEIARAVDISADGTSIYIAGNTASYGNGDFDVVLLRYSQQGNLTLAKTWGGTALEQAHAINVRDPFVYIAGETRSFGAGLEDAFLLKVDVEGGNTIPEFGSVTPLLLIMALITASLALLRLRKKGANSFTTHPILLTFNGFISQ